MHLFANGRPVAIHSSGERSPKGSLACSLCRAPWCRPFGGFGTHYLGRQPTAYAVGYFLPGLRPCEPCTSRGAAAGNSHGREAVVRAVQHSPKPRRGGTCLGWHWPLPVSIAGTPVASRRDSANEPIRESRPCGKPFQRQAFSKRFPRSTRSKGRTSLANKHWPKASATPPLARLIRQGSLPAAKRRQVIATAVRPWLASHPQPPR
jgi:hypothetical protein